MKRALSRHWLLVGTALSVLAALLATLWASRARPERDPWSYYLARRPSRWNEDTPYRFYAQTLRFLRDLEDDRPEWGRDEVRQAIEWGSAWKALPDSRVRLPSAELTPDEKARLWASEQVQTVLSTRLALGGPLSTDAKAASVQFLLEGLTWPRDSQREGAVASLMSGPLADDPAIRSRVEAMTNDPEPRVAAMARLKLAQYRAFKSTDGPSRGTITREDANP